MCFNHQKKVLQKKNAIKGSCNTRRRFHIFSISVSNQANLKSIDNVVSVYSINYSKKNHKQQNQRRKLCVGSLYFSVEALDNNIINSSIK